MRAVILFLVTAIVLAVERVALACPSCRQEVERAIYDGDTFWGRLGLAVLPFVLVGIVTAAVAWAPERRRSA